MPWFISWRDVQVDSRYWFPLSPTRVAFKRSAGVPSPSSMSKSWTINVPHSMCRCQRSDMVITSTPVGMKVYTHVYMSEKWVDFYGYSVPDTWTHRGELVLDIQFEPHKLFRDYGVDDPARIPGWLLTPRTWKCRVGSFRTATSTKPRSRPKVGFNFEPTDLELFPCFVQHVNGG